MECVAIVQLILAFGYQIYLGGALNDQVVALPAHANTIHTRIRNERDSILQGINTNEYNSFAE